MTHVIRARLARNGQYLTEEADFTIHVWHPPKGQHGHSDWKGSSIARATLSTLMGDLVELIVADGSRASVLVTEASKHGFCFIGNGAPPAYIDDPPPA